MSKVLVTGASGFCGRYLCRALSQSGHDVVGTFHHSKPVAESGIHYLKLNIADAHQVFRLVKAIQPQQMFHLAALSIPRLSWQRPTETFAMNTAGTLHILEALRRFAPKTRMLFTSSVHVYGRIFRLGKTVTEGDLLWPESPYGVSKAVAEMACLDYHQRFGIPVIVARAINHMGAGQSPDLVLSDWSRQVARAESDPRIKTLKVGNLDVWRQFLHVEDVVKAYQVLMARGKPGRVYNVAPQDTDFLKNYARCLIREARVPLRVEVERARLRLEDPKRMQAKAKRLRALGWKPKKTAYDALSDMVEDWREKVKHG